MDQDPRPLPGACLRQETSTYLHDGGTLLQINSPRPPARAYMTDLTRDFGSLSDSRVELVGWGEPYFPLGGATSRNMLRTETNARRYRGGGGGGGR